MITSGPATSGHANPQARRRLRAMLALLTVVFLAVDLGSTTTTAASAYGYDAPAVARVDAQAFGGAKASSTQLGDTQEGSDSRSVEDRRTTTTPRSRSVATNKAFASVDDLTGSTLSNYNRFVKNLPAAAETPTIRNLADGAVEFSAKVPATNIPGSYATYTKVVSSDGITTSFIKTTIAPDGSVVSVKVKFP